MLLNELKSPVGSRKKKRIVGRGRGTGRGKTSGRGEKGQMSRSGKWKVGGSEGGQMPLIRRIPKVGFNPHRPILNQVVNVESLNKFKKDSVVNAESLKKQSLIGSLNKPFKILGDGELKVPLTLQVASISKSAIEKVEKAGGRVEIIATNYDLKAQASTKKKK